MWTWLLVLTARTRELFSKKSSDRDFDEELRSHLDMLVDRHIQRGMTPEAARREARLQLGGGMQLAEMHRERRSFPVIDTLVQDVRYAVRGFRRSPSFTLVAVATLALGIGANTTMYSVVHATILRKLPFADPDRLMKVSLVTAARGSVPSNDDMVWSVPKYEAFTRLQNVFETSALFRGTRQSLTGTADPEQLQIEQVGAAYFPVLGAQAALGRTFRSEEDSDQSTTFVAVLSDGLWKRRFGSDPAIVGRTVELDQRPYTIVGVMPPAFRALSGPTDAWTTVHTADPGDVKFAEAHSWRMVARLRAGVTPASAAAATAAAGTTLDGMFAGPIRGWSARAVELDATRLVPSIRRAVLVLFAAVGLVLLIACVNMANLLLVRGTVRQRELSIRIAIGAGRRRLIAQLLTESIVLASVGAAAGLVVAWVGVQALAALNPLASLTNTGPGPLARMSGLTILGFSTIRLDTAALLFTGAIALVTGVLFGLAPAVQASRADIADALKSSGTTKPLPPRALTFDGRSLLVVSELALSLVLLVGAGLMIRSLGKLTAIDLGLTPDRLLTLRLSVPAGAASQSESTFTQLMERIAATAGVQSVALGDCTALSGGCSRALFDPSTDTPGAPGKIRPEVGIHVASSGYLEAMKIPLIKGRWLTDSDVRDRPRVAVVSQMWAQRFWPGQEPVGRRIGISRPGFNKDVEVIGVVGDVRYARIDDPPIPDVYVSYRQVPPRAFYVMFVRTAADPLTAVPAIREQVRSAGGNLVAADVRTMPERLGDATAQARFNAVLFASFAGLALALAAVGIYGVMAYSVTERTREIGIRVALGARRSDVVGLFVRRAAILTAAGLALGLAGALSASRVLTTLLYEIQPYDLATYLIISGLLATVALIAVWVPARRAASVDPTVALRAE